MKSKYHIHTIAVALTLLGVFATGCKKDFLAENPVSSLTTDVYYKTATGYEDLVRSCYPILRNIHQARQLVLNGTDLFYPGGYGDPKFPTTAANAGSINQYDVGLNGSVADIGTYWTLLYTEIGRTNTAVSRAAAVTGMTDALKATRVSEAKFLRSLCLFYAVQQWGDVPMPLQEAQGATKSSVRVPAADVYKQIIADLLEGETNLPVTATDYGRVTKGAAQFLLSRVYLTRGWNFNNSLGGTSADFTSALVYADKIIAAYPLAAKYKDLFPIKSKNPLAQYTGAQTDKNAEVVFAVQYSSDVLTSKTDAAFTQDAAGGGNLHSVFGPYGTSPESFPGTKGRTSDYNRFQPIYTPGYTVMRLFDPQLDSRYDNDFLEVGYALAAVSNFKPLPNTNASLTINIKAGDTVVYFRPWNNPATTPAQRGIDVGGTRNYSVINGSEWGGGYSIVNNVSTTGFPTGEPIMWKFWQPGITYGDAFGTFNENLFRAGEAYLIAAEAIVKGATGGKLGGADVYYNKVLDRALTTAGQDPKCAAVPENIASLTAVSYRATPANINIDLILDERARELFGEYDRWYDLKRTGKLIERVLKFNPWAKKSNTLKAFHYLRPLPQAEIDLSFPAMAQNPGY